MSKNGYVFRNSNSKRESRNGTALQISKQKKYFAVNKKKVPNCINLIRK